MNGGPPPTTPTTPNVVVAAEKKKKNRCSVSPVAFHVVAPSIPGTGFSDASTAEAFGVAETADTFDVLMKRLGYERYVVYGAGW